MGLGSASSPWAQPARLHRGRALSVCNVTASDSGMTPGRSGHLSVVIGLATVTFALTAAVLELRGDCGLRPPLQCLWMSG